MAVRDIVVVGFSAGGIDPLLRLVGTLPADLPGAGFVVVQDDATSAVTGMPRAARGAGTVDRVLPLGESAAELESLAGSGAPA